MPRRFAALLLSAVAFAAPLLCAIGIASGSSRYWQAVAVVWAIGAIPGLVLTAVVAARPRLPRVVAGMALLEVMLIGAAYVVAFAIAGSSD